MTAVSVHPASVGGFIDKLQEAFREGDPEAASKAAEGENVRRLQELYRAVARGDFGPLGAALGEDIEMEMLGPPGAPLVGRWRGRHQVAEAVRRNFSQLEDQRAELLGVVAQGDTVVLLAREQGVLRATGRRYDLHWAQWFTFRGGSIVRFRGLFDSAALLEAAHQGPAPDPGPVGSA